MQQLAHEAGPWRLPGRSATRLSLDHGKNGSFKQAVLLEVDVTRARSEIRARNRGTQCSVSFIAWVVKNVACSLVANPVQDCKQTRRAGQKRSAAVTLLIDRPVEGSRVVVPVTISHAGRRSLSSIASTIRHLRETPMNPGQLVTGKARGARSWVFLHLPRSVRRALVRRCVRRPTRSLRVRGDVVLSSAGMGGRAKGWFIPSLDHPVTIGIGAVTPRGVVINGGIQRRDVFHMAVVVDDEAVSSANASTWVSGLLRTMEKSRGIYLN